MEFFSEPAFFVLLALATIPAAILGLLERRIKFYGLAVSITFIVLLFMRNPFGLVFLFIFLILAVGVTWLYRWLEKSRSRQSVDSQRTLHYWPGVALLIAPLVMYKVGAAANADIWGFIGISYITFKAVQVLLEVKDHLIDKISMVDYLYFLLFFAPFVSGPIDRSRRFIEDVNTVLARRVYLDLLAKGILLILTGVLYKVVISALIFNFYSWVPTRATTALFDALLVLLDAYAWGLYLFFDFAGYSLMAMGAGYCFGIQIPRNFKAPFLALDIKDFWNRWHITLSHWLRDFVFMRFSRVMLRKKYFSSRIVPACLGYLLNMGVMGVWHGLTLDYILYGLYHGTLLASTEVLQKRWGFYKRHRGQRWFKLASWFITINLVFFGFALFSGQVSRAIGGL